MEYSKQYYGSLYKCPYCGTEHHIDLLGRIEEYKVKFMWQGHLFEAYLTSFRVDYCSPIETTYIGYDGRSCYIPSNQSLTFEFTGHIVDKEE